MTSRPRLVFDGIATDGTRALQRQPLDTAARCLGDDFKLAHPLEALVAIFNLRGSEGAQAFQGKCFHVKAGEHAAEHDRFAQRVEAHLAVIEGRKIPGQASREGIPRASRIVDVFERIGAAAKELAIRTKRRAPCSPFFMTT